MTKYFIGATGALLGALGGVWLMVAPFFLAYQPEGADWADPTFVDFWTGLLLLVVSVVGFAVFVVSLVGELRDRGIITRRVPVSYSQGQENGQQGEAAIEQAITPLLAEMLKEMQQQRGIESSAGSQVSGTTASPQTNQQSDAERRA